MSRLVPVSGLGALTDAIAADFAARQIPARVDFGLKARSFQINQGPGGASRVVVIPGEYDGTLAPKGMKGGKLGAPMHMHAQPEPNEALGWDGASTLSIWAVDASSPEALRSERAQYEATITLWELTVQAIRGAVDPQGVPLGPADIVWLDTYWTRPPVEMGFGQELLVTFELHGPFYDAPIDRVSPGLSLNRAPFGAIPRSV